MSIRPDNAHRARKVVILIETESGVESSKVKDVLAECTRRKTRINLEKTKTWKGVATGNGERKKNEDRSRKDQKMERAGWGK